jgi:hypothetical protein
MRDLFLQIIPMIATIVSLATSGHCATDESSSATGVEGVISEGPIHGGPSNRGEPETRPLVNVEFVFKSGTGTTTSVRTDNAGRFVVLLSPGHYTVSRQGGEFPCGNEVDVVVGKVQKVQWTCDTGMR